MTTALLNETTACREPDDPRIVEAAKLLGFWIQPNGFMFLVNQEGVKHPTCQIPSAKHLEKAQRVIVELLGVSDAVA